MNVMELLKERHMEFQVCPHAETRDAQRLAQSLHVCGKQVVKTVMLKADQGFAYIVALVPADKRVNLDKLSKAMGGSRLEIATEEEVIQHCPDCEPGVLPPFGSEYGMQTWVDSSLAHENEIFFEANTHHDAVRMRFIDFRQMEEPLVASFAE